MIASERTCCHCGDPIPRELHGDECLTCWLDREPMTFEDWGD